MGKRAEQLLAQGIRIIVREELGHALENGEDLKAWTVDEILQDLNRYSAACEEFTLDEMRPHVEDWRREQLQ